MKLRTVVSSTLLLTVLVGCDQASSGTCDAVVHDGFRKLGLNGVSLNGVSLNGRSDNGTSLNGVSLNGRLNGVSLNGIELSDVAVAGDEGPLANVELVGTAMVGTSASGVRISGNDWIGAVIQASVGTEMIDMQIAAVERDPTDASIEWYVLEVEGAPLCGAGVRGLFLPGVWDESGAHHDSLAGASEVAYTFACENGVIAKCVDWGYAPYTAGADAHQTCTRLARADYCGNGTAHTADGTLIDVFDVLGVQESDPSVDLAFEAGWGPDGAVCVSRPRYTEIGSGGDELAIDCLDELPACDAADEAIAEGATLMNRSAPKTLCYE